MSAPQEGGCIKVFPIATALARAYNCLLLPGLGVTAPACLSPGDSTSDRWWGKGVRLFSLLLFLAEERMQDTVYGEGNILLLCGLPCCVKCTNSNRPNLCTCVVVALKTRGTEPCALTNNSLKVSHRPNTEEKMLSDSKGASKSCLQTRTISRLWPLTLFICMFPAPLTAVSKLLLSAAAGTEAENQTGSDITSAAPWYHRVEAEKKRLSEREGEKKTRETEERGWRVERGSCLCFVFIQWLWLRRPRLCGLV